MTLTAETSSPTSTEDTAPLAVTVTAVLVAHDGAAWLPRALAAVSAQTWLPDRVIGVDTGSTDETPGLLRRQLGAERVVTVGRTVGFGDAVRAGLAGSPAEPAEPAEPAGTDRTEWLWLLHDDCAPEPETLARLLEVVRRSSSIGVAGPKLVGWDDGDRLLEVGLTTSRGGRRMTDIDPGERDQGQQDHRHDVLAVGTAGLLVRRDVWDRLGGLDPALPLFRDDIDFGWRAQLAGYRVVVVPNARVADAQASARGLRSVDAVTGAPHRVDRTHGVRVALAGAPVLALPFLLLWFAAGGLLRAAGLIVAKQPRRAYDELVSVWAAVLTPWRVVGSRWRARGTREVPRRDIAQLLAPRRSSLRGIAETFSGSMGRRQVEVIGAASPETGPAAEESENVERVTSRLTRRVLTNPGFLVVTVTTAVTAVLARPLVGRGALTGGQLLGWNGPAAQAWHSYADAWHGAGLGTDAPPSPYRAVLAGLAWLLQPLTTHPTALAVDVVLIGALPLSALTAYVAARTVLRNRWLRAWAALTWATLPTVTSALAGGRLGASMLHILLPLVVLGFARTVRRPGSSTAAFAGGLVLAIAGSFAPVLLLVALGAVVVAVVLGGWARRARALVFGAVPAVLLLPWLPALWDEPRLFLAGPGLLAPAGSAPDPLHLALLHPGGAGTTYAVLSVPLLLVGLAGLFRRGPSWLLASCGLLGLVGLGLALLLPRLVIATGTEATAASGLTGSIVPWPGPALDLVALAALVAALHGADGVAARLSQHRFGWRQLILAPLSLAALGATVATAAFAILNPIDGPVRRDRAALLPAVAVDQATGPLATRTLVLTAGGDGVGYRLVGAEIGDAATTLPLPEGQPLVAEVTQTLVAPSADVTANTTAQALVRLGIGFVVATRPVPEAFAQQLDTTAGLTRLGESGTYALWRVEPAALQPATSGPATPPPARVRIVDAAGALVQDVPVAGPDARVDTAVPAGQSGRQVVLAEPADGLWHATLDGHRLSGVNTGGLQAFRLPATGGRLRIAATDDRDRLLPAQGIALVVVALLALPVGRRRRTDGRPDGGRA
jgi:GT2 family glycosyltransferase